MEIRTIIKISEQFYKVLFSKNNKNLKITILAADFEIKMTTFFK